MKTINGFVVLFIISCFLMCGQASAQKVTKINTQTEAQKQEIAKPSSTSETKTTQAVRNLEIKPQGKAQSVTGTERKPATQSPGTTSGAIRQKADTTSGRKGILHSKTQPKRDIQSTRQKEKPRKADKS